MRLQDEHPELCGQLHPTRNVGVDLDSISNSSHEMLWWRCPVGHEWRETPLQRRSHARWKKGDLYACLYCVAPGAVVHSCGHRRLRPSETTFRVLAHPCERCEVTEHTRLILDALDGSAAAAPLGRTHVGYAPELTAAGTVGAGTRRVGITAVRVRVRSGGGVCGCGGGGGCGLVRSVRPRCRGTRRW